MKKSKLWTVVCAILVVVFLVSCMSTLIACKDKNEGNKTNEQTNTDNSGNNQQGGEQGGNGQGEGQAEPAKYTVTFVVNDETYATKEYTEGEAIILPTAPGVSYAPDAWHGFGGWFNGETQFTAKSTLTGDLTVTAKWVDNSVTVERSAGTLVVGYNNFNEKFSPFFATSAYDQDVTSMTQVGLLSVDRGGNIVYNGIEGETTPYNGTDYTYYGMGSLVVTQNLDGSADYKITLRSGVTFSDGNPVTIKDVVFSIYVLCDSDYDGSSTFYSLPVAGMGEWRTNLKTDVLAKWTAIADAILATYSEEAGAYVYAESTAYTQAQFDSFVAALNADEGGWAELAKDIVGKVSADYAAYATPGNTSEVGMGMEVWGFAGFENGVLTDSNGKTYNYANGEEPTIQDYVDCLKAAYENNLVKAAGTEKANGDYATYANAVAQRWIAASGKAEMGDENVNSISGITFSVEENWINVHTTEFSATTVYQLGVTIAPMHYYGNTALWNPAEGSYGFTRGDLNGVRAKTTQPMGAGPYKFVEYKDGIVTFVSNDNYWEGTPKIKNIMFKEMSDANKLPSVAKGQIDVAEPSLNDSTVSQINKANGNNKLSREEGLTVVTDLVDNNGYGYIGLNSDRVLVGTDKASEASKNLRKGIATLFAAYREYTVNSYYGPRASVIQYPISNTSWAAPQPADEGYAIAYSTDVNGAAIYTDGMTEEQRWAAAKTAMIGYLKAAGYTWDEGTSKFTAAPEGAKMSYEVIIGGDGTGNHPTYALLVKCKEVLASVGITLEITDDSDNLFDRMEAGNVDMFVAAWGNSIDPDMYQVYHSSNATGSNHYRIADTTLDEKIMEARTKDDKTFRKNTYKECLDIILDWAVEIPTYQRKNCHVFNGNNVKVSTITPDTTPFWSYLAEIYKLEVNE